jgi:hypothetical protein
MLWGDYFTGFVLRKKQQQHAFLFHATLPHAAGYFVHAFPLLPIAVSAAVEVVPSTP